MSIVEKVGTAALDLAQNGDVLDKSSDILGMLFPYAGLKKKALDMYISDVEKSDMSSESKLIAVLNAKDTIKKLKNQKNIAEIAVDTSRDGTDFTEKSGVNREWLERFMDSAGYVSDETVQLMWGKILGKEFEEPGSTPLNMMRILSEITPVYAQAFKKICNMQILLIGLDETDTIVNVRRAVLVPYIDYKEIINAIGLTFDIINELETLGLIKLAPLTGYAVSNIRAKHVLLYVDGEIQEVGSHHNNVIPTGNVILTSAGRCLYNITPMEKIVGYSEWIKKYMEDQQVKLKKNSDYKVSIDGDTISCEKI